MMSQQQQNTHHEECNPLTPGASSSYPAIILIVSRVFHAVQQACRTRLLEPAAAPAAVGASVGQTYAQPSSEPHTSASPLALKVPRICVLRLWWPLYFVRMVYPASAGGAAQVCI